MTGRWLAAWLVGMVNWSSAKAQLFTFDFDEGTVQPSAVAPGLQVPALVFPGSATFTFAMDSPTDRTLEILTSQPFTTTFTIQVNPFNGRRLNLSGLDFDHKASGSEPYIWGVSLLVTFQDGSFDFVELARGPAGEEWTSVNFDLAGQSVYQDVTSVTIPFEAGGPILLDNIRLSGVAVVPEARETTLLAGGLCLIWAAMIRKKRMKPRTADAGA